ncbi:Spaetzle, partial [Trinorchestia longiramus]
SCAPGPPAQLCPTKYNTTAPMWGRSLTSGQRVTIVQKFPDLLQQVIFHECTSQNCDIIHGKCTQTFTPYLFLVIPLGPVTLTGQDYVMVESGCACQPKYSSG